MADFYVRYYVGHKGKFGHEFLEFEFRPDGEHVSLKLAGDCHWGGCVHGPTNLALFRCHLHLLVVICNLVGTVRLM